MSVLLPPPKRQKVYHGIAEPETLQVSDESVPNVVVQFVNDQDGSPLAPTVNLPANVTKDVLESLVNKLRPQVRLSHLLHFRHSPHSLLFFSSFRRTMIPCRSYSISMHLPKR